MNENSSAMESSSKRTRTLLLGTVGAIVGALIGFAVFKTLLSVGLYALIAPGAIAGIVANRFARQSSMSVGIISLVVAAIATILSQWNVGPFPADESLQYFVTHLHRLPTAAMIMGGLGVILAFLSGRGM